MKNLFLLMAFSIMLSSTMYAQNDTKFGVTAGYLNLQEKFNSDEGDISENFSGFYVGAFADISISEALRIVPGVNYGNVEDTGLLFIPVMVKFNIAESGVYLLGGPQGTLILDNESQDSIDSFGVDLSLGAGYNITEKFFVEARYAFELTDRLSDDIDTQGFDINYKINNLFVGIGYKF